MRSVDPWGLDPSVLAAVSPLLGLRWDIEVDNAHRLPGTGPALLLANRRFGLSEPFVVARGLRLASGRPVRVVGVPDVDPVGPVLRKLGGVLERPDEVAGLLRAGEIVVAWCGHTPRPGRHVGAAVPSPETTGPLAVADLAGAAREGLRRLLLEAR